MQQYGQVESGLLTIALKDPSYREELTPYAQQGIRDQQFSDFLGEYVQTMSYFSKTDKLDDSALDIIQRHNNRLADGMQAYYQRRANAVNNINARIDEVMRNIR